MKTMLLLPLLLTGCMRPGWRTTYGLAFENEDGTRVEATASFEQTGKRVIPAGRGK